MKFNNQIILLKKQFKPNDLKFDIYLNTLLQYFKLRLDKLTKDAVFAKIPLMEVEKKL